MDSSGSTAKKCLSELRLQPYFADLILISFASVVLKLNPQPWLTTWENGFRQVLIPLKFASENKAQECRPVNQNDPSDRGDVVVQKAEIVTFTTCPEKSLAE